MKKRLLSWVLLFVLLPPGCWAQSSGTVSVEVSDLLRLQTLLQTMSEQYESATAQSSELQKIINASEKELSALNLNLDRLWHEVQDWTSISEAQASELNRLLPLLAEQDKISKRQAELLGVTLAQNRRMKITLWVGIPAAVLTGSIITWGLTR